MKFIKLSGTAAIITAGLALTGCSMVSGETEAKETKTQKPTISVDGDFVYAPAAGSEDSGDEASAPEPPTAGDAPNVGDLFTMSVDGTKVTVTKQSCSVDAEGVAEPTTDARETAFGEFGEASSETAAPVTWLEAGAFAEKDKSELKVLSEDMIKVGEKTFFAADSDQGTALSEQFSEGCSTPDDDDENTEDAEPEPTSPTQPGAPTSEPSEPSDAGGEQ